ncbi:MAG: succinate dehydrogenase/fumarate reductase iron-sulfur subunit [Deltaproteobacteria bacterium]|nr:succinate dehydrogenase/fumarate reductase iron-sulfur subunit [Deltaproteobacteria bacterium]
MRVTLHIYRHDPDSGRAPGYQTVEIEAEPDETVSGALQYVYEIIDPTLAFRFVCNMQKCGECSVVVNGVPCLACEKKVDPEMTIEPLSNLPVIKDLVIDRNRVISDIFETAPFLRHPVSQDKGAGLSSGISDHTIKLGMCVECLICQSVCPVYKESPARFTGPLGIVWLAQMEKDVNNDAWRSALNQHLELCDLCGKCWKVCPDEMHILAHVFKRLKLHSGGKDENKKS